MAGSTHPSDALVIFVQGHSIVALSAISGELQWVYVPFRTFTGYHNTVLGGGRLHVGLSKCHGCMYMYECLQG